jgi:hypothetical protein
VKILEQHLALSYGTDLGVQRVKRRLYGYHLEREQGHSAQRGW